MSRGASGERLRNKDLRKQKGSAMVELIIFDADGVLFESEESNIAFYNAIFQAVGEPPLTREEANRCIFLSANQVFELRAHGAPERLKEMREASTRLDFEAFFKLLKPSVELRPFLLDLRSRYKLGLATNRSATVAGMLKYLGIGDLFHAVASCADDVRPKPAPDMLHLCVERAGVETNKAVYVGDSATDELAAKAAGIHFLGVGSRIESAHRVPRLEDVPAVIDLLPRRMALLQA
jgi:phosphoglycolate phosphatase